MFNIKNNTLMVSDFANYLGHQFEGDDFVISGFAHCSELSRNSITYVGSHDEIPFDASECLVLCSVGFTRKSNISYIVCSNPIVDFYNIVNEFFVEGLVHGLADSCVVSKSAELGVNVNIGFNSYIGNNVSVGDNTFIGNNVIVKSNVVIGRNCYVKDGAIIGSEGFDFISDNDKLIHIPQVGQIVIEDSVWIGSNSVIERATLNKTFIGKGVKIDDLVQVGNSSKVQSNTQIAAGVVVGANVFIGSNCFLGMNVSVKENIRIANDVIVGSGASVVVALSDAGTYIGVPAKKYYKRKL